MPDDTSKPVPQSNASQAAKVEKTDAQWQEILDADTYQVTRQHGTEPAYSHPGFPKAAGTFHCVCCGAELFTQETKYESHCGWPAFYAPKDGAPVGETHDTSHGMSRTEVHCDTCGAHLGHVFPDGPKPTGTRYCINGVALHFEPNENASDKDEA
ncbi:peptide-methionine (R)-S-oxide reductase MsrB [Pacificibacter marinus]|uniref:peptide-methionine (R)-S-oxide reductase n=1 Tax=Pacificibacter marinus TaxID=658057 RepID=A0A1Y5RQ44_9RHOB|nr:peptide-methionine (R)-S-oxide reductase MsrB [Pacificibacter marinus]SEL32043.1 peptide-methionine (R)-S-oxide reductase [Pacificibacter marinus]SLN22713.1 Peptide methionine sulfoxide reductase MsrB [Pacificibacter marinus]